MKTIKYFVVMAMLVTGFSSCLVVRDRPGYYGRPHHHYHHGYGYYR
ncbi:hypothetical protein [Chitinophaga tropicalis]|uniref:Lipoprotein n=1 Tax=Chitinophaga tropicalis TaxID=2683588 RepID=A0A7K1U7D8_9BACT|nr:hypothetical protein [Chitinophaga tropicalis]MVT10274.1 hypothetical protein [Chitinophaga tropicalis]